MKSELIQRLHSARLTQGEVRSLATQLPVGDCELRSLLDTLVATADEPGVTALVWAMVAGGRKLDASLLPSLLPLMGGLDGVSVAALWARGEVVEGLLAAVESGIMGWEREAVTLLIAGWICLHREPKRELPPGLIPKARLLAREVTGEREALLPLFVLAQLTHNPALQTVLEESITPPPPATVAAAIEFIIEKPLRDPLGSLPEQADRVISAGGQLRRAVAKVGRNDPCPCGSGKKYKKCCYEKDQERLQHSSEVAGVTVEELEAMPEPFLTREKLEGMRGPKLALLHVEMLSPELQRVLLERLSVFRQTEAMLAAWEKVGWRRDLQDTWEMCVFDAVRTRQRDVVGRLVALPGVPQEDDTIPFGARLVLAQAEPEKFLQLIEDSAERSLRNPKDLSYLDVAYALVEGHLPGLGTLVARGAAAIATPFDAEMLFESIYKVRDRLDLPPEDPGEWLLDRLFELPEDADEPTHEALAEARRQIDATSAEAKHLRAQLVETRAQLERQERLARNKPAADSAAAPVGPDAATTALRARVDELKSALKQRHAERNALRRELNEVMEETAELRQAKANVASPVAATEPEREEQALLAEETTPLQPLRVPVFSSRFSQALTALPQHVARAAMTLIGRLGAGEPAAFVGMRRLRANREICRVRVAADYRLLFKPHADRLEVLDLINRKDFEKWLKTLA